MLVVKQSGKQQKQECMACSQPEAELDDWAVESCDAEFSYQRIRTADSDACTGTANVIDVASIDATIEKFLAGGGTVVRPKLLISGIGTLITCRDSVGHVFTFMEEKLPANPERPTFKTINW